MSVDVGIPIGGCIAMTGADIVPVNFLPLDGGVVNEPRSVLNGVTLPNWNSDEVETIPHQLSPYDGSYYKGHGALVEVPLDAKYLPAVKIKYAVTHKMKGVTFNGSSGGSGEILYASNFSANNIWSIDKPIYYSTGNAIAGSGTSILRENTATASYTAGMTAHAHTFNIKHYDSHSWTAWNTNHSYLGRNLHGFRRGSTVSITSTGTTASSVDYPLKRATTSVRWYMRIY